VTRWKTPGLLNHSSEVGESSAMYHQPDGRHTPRPQKNLDPRWLWRLWRHLQKGRKLSNATELLRCAYTFLLVYSTIKIASVLSIL